MKFYTYIALCFGVVALTRIPTATAEVAQSPLKTNLNTEVIRRAFAKRD